ncbi:MAG: hypothetical protein JNM17_28305 [Archangium sp.]|nr:hypothetical protein [Archangium sp.]
MPKPTAKSKPKPKTKRSAEVTVKIDAALRALWNEASSRLTHATSAGAQAWDERYEAIADIVEHQPPLYLAGGFATDRAFFEKSVGEDHSTVYRNVRVAKYASAKEVELYGASRLDAAITFVETQNGGALKGRTPIDFAALRFTTTGGKKSLADATVEDLREAIAHLKGNKAASEKASPEAVAIKKLLSAAKVKGVTFDVRKDLVVLRVPLKSLSSTAKALAKYA